MFSNWENYQKKISLFLHQLGARDGQMWLMHDQSCPFKKTKKQPVEEEKVRSWPSGKETALVGKSVRARALIFARKRVGLPCFLKMFKKVRLCALLDFQNANFPFTANE